jgi:hypothetical protein
MIDTSSPGDFTAYYTLSISDENLPGAINLSPMTLELHGTVMAVPEPATIFMLLTVVVGVLIKRKITNS